MSARSDSTRSGEAHQPPDYATCINWAQLLKLELESPLLSRDVPLAGISSREVGPKLSYTRDLVGALMVGSLCGIADGELARRRRTARTLQVSPPFGVSYFQLF